MHNAKAFDKGGPHESGALSAQHQGCRLRRASWGHANCKSRMLKGLEVAASP